MKAPSYYFLLCPLLIALGACAIQPKSNKPIDHEPWRKLLGSWQVTSAQTSFILSVEPDRQALLIWINPGSHTMGRFSWIPFHGGILVQGLPRIRLWSGSNDDELRGEMEIINYKTPPKSGTTKRFFMRRIRHDEIPKQILDHPVPEQWLKETLDDESNNQAGGQLTPD